MPADKLPSFERPPVVETVLGVQFRRLEKFSNAHLGAFWRYLNSSPWSQLPCEWPHVVDAAALDAVFESFDEGAQWLHAGLKLTNDPSTRIQIRSAADDAMIQLQNGRLHYNWLRRAGQEYPRYASVRPRFDELLDGLKRFLADEGLGELAPNQWEVTYVNHIPKDTVWHTPSDWSKVLVGLFGAPSGSSPARLEDFHGAWSFEIEPRRGRLHVDIRRARDQSGVEVLRLMFTARGPAAGATGPGLPVSDGLDLGRETIVTKFKEITSPEAHLFWGLRT